MKRNIAIVVAVLAIILGNNVFSSPTTSAYAEGQAPSCNITGSYDVGSHLLTATASYSGGKPGGWNILHIDGAEWTGWPSDENGSVTKSIAKDEGIYSVSLTTNGGPSCSAKIDAHKHELQKDENGNYIINVEPSQQTCDYPAVSGKKYQWGYITKEGNVGYSDPQVSKGNKIAIIRNYGEIGNYWTEYEENGVTKRVYVHVESGVCKKYTGKLNIGINKVTDIKTASNTTASQPIKAVNSAKTDPDKAVTPQATTNVTKVSGISPDGFLVTSRGKLPIKASAFCLSGGGYIVAVDSAGFFVTDGVGSGGNNRRLYVPTGSRLVGCTVQYPKEGKICTALLKGPNLGQAVCK